METTFLTNTGTVLFVRNDMEQGNFVHEEYSLTATFPYNAKKVIREGQRLYFRNFANGIECFEIRKVTNIEPDHYQQIIAEHIVISELADEHINKTEITDKTPSHALTTVLTGTLWSVGNASVSSVNSVDIARGDVWQAVISIMQNWNVYIVPRLTFNSAGTITGRYLDIVSSEGVFRGARLSIDLNMSDPAVTYDDSEVKTALYGYGGSVEKAQASGDDKTEELTFKDVVWTATSSHPAKPSGQTYLEDPAKTALYGRGGRPRFGYYQNANIKDANTLLEKTWESLKLSSDPKVTVAGTISELYRLGYKGQPINLHDLVIVEIRPINVLLHIQIIKFDENLIDPTDSRVEIGEYIPNIVYINRETDKKASGGGGGGRSRDSMTNLEDDDIKTWTDFVRTNQLIGMVVGTRNGTDYIKGGEITLAINEDGGTTAKIQADTLDIQGIASALESENVRCGSLHVEGRSEFYRGATFEAGLDTHSGSPIDCGGVVNADQGFTVGGLGGNKATWQTMTNHTITVSGNHMYLYGDANLNPTGRISGALVTSHGTDTIHYLGY